MYGVCEDCGHHLEHCDRMAGPDHKSARQVGMVKELGMGYGKVPASERQEGGNHYMKLAIQPAQYVHDNRIPYLEGSVIYYVTRWCDKNGIADIKKAIHTLELIVELEEGERK